MLTNRGNFKRASRQCLAFHFSQIRHCSGSFIPLALCDGKIVICPQILNHFDEMGGDKLFITVEQTRFVFTAMRHNNSAAIIESAFRHR